MMLFGFGIWAQVGPRNHQLWLRKLLTNWWLGVDVMHCGFAVAVFLSEPSN